MDDFADIMLAGMEPEVPEYMTPWGRGRPQTTQAVREWMLGRRVMRSADLCATLAEVHGWEKAEKMVRDHLDVMS